MGAGISTKYEKTTGIKAYEKAKADGNKLTEIKNTMPCYREAYTDPDKFYRYSLDETNPNGRDKAIHYKTSLGFDKTNADSLISQIDQYVKNDASVPERVVKTDHGYRYRYKVPVSGPNGETKNVIAVYQIDLQNSIPRLITNYLE